VASVVAFLAVVFLAVGCGPSFQAVYESDVHFEHCYALDQSLASSDSKRDCWRAWLRAYTYGQPRDRVDYASARFVALSPDEGRSSPKVAAAAASSARPAIDAPVPTNAFAPPPNIALAAPIADSGVPSVDAAPRAPGVDCADACASAWETCRGACKGAACAPCDNTYRTCMPACFVDKKPVAP
jgi:hypothetical protein